MKKNLILLLVFVVLGVIAWYLYDKARITQTMSSISEERAFTVESPDVIHKIILKRKDDKPLVFEKKSGTWYLNEKYKADDVVVGYMVQVLTKVKMKSIPSKNAVPTITKNMETRGIVVEIYDVKGEVLKKITIGSDLQSGDGTYMLLDGFRQPYAVELPSLGGGLRSRFEQPLERYRDRYIYNEAADMIQSLTVEYHKDMNASYVIENKGVEFTIRPLDSSVAALTASPNQNKIKTYLGFFEELGAELLYNHYENKDAMLKSEPFCTITLVRKDQVIKTYQYWNYDEIVQKFPERTRSADAAYIGRFFVWTGEDLFTVQTGVFGKIFSAYTHFY